MSGKSLDPVLVQHARRDELDDFKKYGVYTKVPIEDMLSKRGQGFKIAMNALNVGRIKLGVACLDAQRKVIESAVRYANERIQFKTPIAKFGAIKEKIARMATSCFVGESANYRAGYNIESKIKDLKNQGLDDQKAELKGVEVGFNS